MEHGKHFHQAVVGAFRENVKALANVLEVDLRSRGQRVVRDESTALWEELNYYGSNSLAWLGRGGEGVDYPEIVRDVCKKLKVSPHAGDGIRAVKHNERLVLSKNFEDAWEHMSPRERRELLEACDYRERNIPTNGAAAASAVFATKAAGFASYKAAVVGANWVSRAILGHGLSFATNSALTKGLGWLLGPAGMAVSTGWLLKDLAELAMRKTMPAITIVAAIRVSRDESG